MNDTTKFFFIDESGDKGYSNSKPRDGLGVMAGFLIDDWDLPKLKIRISEGLSTLNLNQSNKLHMAELDDTQKTNAVNLVASLFREFSLNFIYSAIYTESYKDFVGPSDKKELLHSQLLQNNLISALTLLTTLIEKFRVNVNLKIVSDNIDAGVLKIMEKECENIVNYMNNAPNKRYYSKGKYIETQVVNASPDPRPKNGKFHVEMSVETSEITFISDVLAYTTFQHLMEFMKENEGLSLNTTKSISGHPLEEFIALVYPPELEDENIFGKVLGPGRGK
ncbi:MULTISPECIES: hypothetical protein [Morganellaceae]|uniref:DUF3800 domain-containing protein n=2 Tax=Moellerella wisconsensis TaxID=158849 RepID=A0A9Q8V4Y7_9GAMM|nr:MULTISPECIES: hypothetical protein [Morganellaceae]ELR5072045.1 hypothetical protein [Providencia rettgeri]ELR5204371.1 hypothetical protein [Providencia rettgeri]MDV5235696.1 hypothetical protein [Providencia rettgeri]UNH29179.1 hypothetical protein MNY64_16725 [Moellerella wisconsensis]UNH32538.1 hypothetical protein MNY72_15975 [Moellerella wisconsensis]